MEQTRRVATHRRSDTPDASTRVAAAARSFLIDLHFAFVVDHAEGRINRAHAWSCEEADFASLGWIKHVEQRCTDAALVLDASTRVGAAAISGLFDLHLAFVVDHANGSINVLMLGLTRKLTLRASAGLCSR